MQAGTLLADTDNALSPASNLVIGDGASVVLNFGNVGAGFGLGGFGAAAGCHGSASALSGSAGQFVGTAALAEPVAPVPAGISTVPEPGTLVLLLVGALAGLLVRRSRKRCQERTVPHHGRTGDIQR